MRSMTLLEIIIVIIVAIAAWLILDYVPWASTVAGVGVLLWALISLIKFWRKNPSIWQMERKARRATRTTKATPPAKNKINNEI